MGFTEYESYDAVGLADLVRRGEVTPEEVLDAALERLAERNPSLNAIAIPMHEEARATLREGIPNGPLRGVPFLLKDLAVLYEGVRTTNGCRFFADNVADHDSEITMRYKRAGLVTFGKSTTPEFGLTSTTESSLFGETHNPWNLAHTPGGSSGGSAAAVAAGILPAAHASDGGGSIRIPASCCGLFGLKPTRGRIPFGPDVGEGWSGLSTMHAVSRSVRDNALLLDLVEGPDLGAPYQARPKERPYVEEVGRPTGQLRVALLTDMVNGLPTHPDCRAAAQAAAKLCQELGHVVEEATLAVDLSAMGTASQCIVSGNVLSILEDRAAAIGRELREEDVEPITWAMTQAVKQRGAAEYARSVRTVHAIGRQVERFLQAYDVILSPTLGAPPEKLGVLSLSNPDAAAFTQAVFTSAGYTQLFNFSGHPAMSVPLHWNAEGLPIGIQFAARLGDEGGLFRLAAQLEEASPWAQRRPTL
ncbi:MAG: amidase [Deltaproteobacteria bacterium]|nr:amidase [Deltaproteobacteria bacterium]